MGSDVAQPIADRMTEILRAGRAEIFELRRQVAAAPVGSQPN